MAQSVINHLSMRERARDWACLIEDRKMFVSSCLVIFFVQCHWSLCVLHWNSIYRSLLAKRRPKKRAASTGCVSQFCEGSGNGRTLHRKLLSNKILGECRDRSASDAIWWIFFLWLIFVSRTKHANGSGKRESERWRGRRRDHVPSCVCKTHFCF